MVQLVEAMGAIVSVEDKEAKNCKVCIMDADKDKKQLTTLRAIKNNAPQL